MGEWVRSRSFSITSGVRQGCVLSPRLFSALLQWVLRQRGTEIGNADFDPGDALGNLVDLRFADDILLFANSNPELAQIFDTFVKAVGQAGLRWNVDKTVMLTNHVQPQNTLVTRDGLILKVVDRNHGQKWLGCILIEFVKVWCSTLISITTWNRALKVCTQIIRYCNTKNNFDMSKADIFQCLRVSSTLFWRWSHPVQETTRCTWRPFSETLRVNCNTTIGPSLVSRVAWNFSSLEGSDPSVRTNSGSETMVILCVSRQH